MSNPLKIKNGVVSGLFQMHDTQGVPLSVSLGECTKRGLRVDWAEFYRSANDSAKRSNGQRDFGSTRKMVEEGIADSGWPQSFLDTVRDAFGPALEFAERTAVPDPLPQSSEPAYRDAH